MVAVKGPRLLNLNCEQMCEGGFQGIPPVPFPANSSTLQEIFLPPMAYGWNDVVFTPNNNYDWVMVFPFNQDCNVKEVTTAYVYINKQCEDDICIYDVDNSQPTENVYGGFRNLTAGSSCGPNYNTPTSATADITFQATQQILLRDVFEAAPPPGKCFQAYITPYACDGLPNGDIYMPKNGSHEPVTSAAASPVSQYELATGNIRVYPNPNNGMFSLALPQTGSYNVKVLSVLGEVVYKATLEGGRTHDIDITSFATGTYTLQLTGAGLHHVEKIMIVR